MDLDELFGWLGAVIFVARLCPQPLRILRTGHRSGVAWLGTANGITSTCGWLVYGVAVERPVLWVPSLVALVPEVVTLALLGIRPPDRRSLAGVAAWALVVGLAYPLGGSAALGTVIGFGVLMGVTPHVVTALRSDRLEGVAVRTWQIALLDAALWGAYGVGTGEPLTTFYGVVLTVGSVVILWRVRTTRRAAAATPSQLPAVGAVGTDPDDVAVVRFADGS